MHGNGHQNFSIYVNSANYVYFKFWTATDKLESSNNRITYTGNYKSFQLINLNESTSIPSSDRTQTNYSIDGGYSFSEILNNENNLRGMSYITQDITGSLPNTFVGNQGLNTKTFYFGHMFSQPYTYNNESIEANTLDYNYRIEYIDNVVCEETIITSMNATINDLPLTCNDLGTYWTLSLSNSTLLKYNTLYHIIVNAIIDGNEETIEEDMIFVVPRNINRKWGYY